MRGSPPKRHSVLTVWDWAADCLEEWATGARAHYPASGGLPALFPSERSGRVDLTQQVGHEHASTTSLYTCVSADYRTAMLRNALDKTLSQIPIPTQPNLLEEVR